MAAILKNGGHFEKFRWLTGFSYKAASTEYSRTSMYRSSRDPLENFELPGLRFIKCIDSGRIHFLCIEF